MTTTSRSIKFTIRPARPEEAGILGELAVLSKGHWGYDADFLEACRDDLALSPEEVATSPVYVHLGESGIAGYYRLLPAGEGEAELDALFVNPGAIGQGVGRRLWEHAVATAQELGFYELIIQSDPYAEGFYRAMGAQRIGELESTVTPGRLLPLLRFTLAAPALPVRGRGEPDVETGCPPRSHPDVNTPSPAHGRLLPLEGGGSGGGTGRGEGSRRQPRPSFM